MYNKRSDPVSSGIGRSWFFTVVLIFCSLQVSFSQEPVVVTTVREPVVVTTVRKPVTSDRKADTVSTREIPTIPSRSVSSQPVKDTVAVPGIPGGGLIKDRSSDSNSIISYDRISAGLGLGLDYGGLGANILLYPQKNVGVFFGLGYNFVKTGVNTGIKARIIVGNSRTNVGISALAMYGYNAAIGVSDRPDLSKVFHGFSLGIGIDFKPWAGTDDYAFTGIYLPVRRPEVKEYIDNLKDSGVQFDGELSPVLIAIGYRITIR